MRKILLLSITLLLSIVINAQSRIRHVVQEVQDFKASKGKFTTVSPFSLDKSGKQMVYQQAARDARVLKLDQSKLSNIIAQKPSALEMTFPFEDRELTVEMVKVDIYSPEFKVQTNKRDHVDYKKGVFYRGIIKGDLTSVVAFSFFDNDIIGVASADNIGNVTLGKGINSDDFVVYNDMKLTGLNPFICSADELMENEKKKISYKPDSAKSPQMTNNCVRVYYEVCNKPYLQLNSNLTSTVNWISAVHNNINTLYVNDGIKMSLKTVYVWETADPYTGTYSQNLAAFRTNRPTFDGDLAHLVNYPSTTSVAYLDSLCGTYKYAYSGINMTYQNVPTYSWTIMAMTHEMGHALGSPHTHACAWNGDDSSIDGCGAVAGYSEGCDGPLPTGGGTIMSYCHLVSSVGINLTKGFGDQPGALIRETVDSKACLGSDCTTACAVTVSNVTVANITKTSITATIVDGTSSEWKYRLLKTSDKSVVKSGTTQNKVFDIIDLAPGTFYTLEIGTDCSTAYQRNRLFLTEDDWCGKTITDTGGAEGKYSNNESWTKTFYPDDQNNQKLKITFQEFDLEDGYDYLRIRNGVSNSAYFSGANSLTGLVIPGPYESTHATGAITLTFSSDGGVVADGFKAMFSCATLGVNDVDFVKDLSVTPNPVKNVFKIHGGDKVKSVQLLDNSGKLIRQFDNDTVSKNVYDVSRLKTGTYILNIKTEEGSVTKKLLKE